MYTQPCCTMLACLTCTLDKYTPSHTGEGTSYTPMIPKVPLSSPPPTPPHPTPRPPPSPPHPTPQPHLLRNQKIHAGGQLCLTGMPPCAREKASHICRGVSSSPARGMRRPAQLPGLLLLKALAAARPTSRAATSCRGLGGGGGGQGGRGDSEQQASAECIC